MGGKSHERTERRRARNRQPNERYESAYSGRGGQPKAKAELELAFTIVAIFRSLTAPVRSAIMRPSHGDSRLLYTHHVLESS